MSFSALGRELYSYDKSVSIYQNEQRFLNNLKRDCKTFGTRKYDDLLTPGEYLETYPKDIAFFFFKKNIKEICYYGISLSFKYLDDHVKPDTETLLVDFINSCLDKQRPYVGCADFEKTPTLFDLTVILGNYCSKRTLDIFKRINCLYKDLKEKECSLYQNGETPAQECPYHYSSKVEVKDLHKNYFRKSCRLKWRPPRCIH
jgi:hypothetical protein